MRIVKKLPAVLIAAVGISFSFAGTALAETILVDNKTLGSGEELKFTPTDSNSGRTKLCFQTSDNLVGKLSVRYIGPVPKLLLFGGKESDLLESTWNNLDLDVSPQEECIDIGLLQSPLTVMNKADPDSFFLSQSIRVRVTQE